MQNQIALLISDPLTRATDVVKPVVLVFDALDECEKQGAEFLPIFVLALRALPKTVKVKLLVTSRLEPSILSMFEKIPHKRFRLHDIEDSIVDADIRAYFKHHFQRIAQSRTDLSLRDWPSEADISVLVERSGRLFIYASAVINLVEMGIPPHRLEALLSSNTGRNDHQYRQLDELYLQVLQISLDNDSHPVGERNSHKHVKAVAGAVCLLRDPLPPSALGQLLGFDEYETSYALGKLGAVLFIPEKRSLTGAPTDSDTVRIYHPSFPDFLLDSARCTDKRFLVDTGAHHAILAQHCLDFMNSQLRRDICDIKDPSLLDSEVHDLSSKVHEHITAALAYSCRFWLEHLRLASKDTKGLHSSLTSFCKKHISNWIEVCSLTNTLPAVLISLRHIHKWFLVRELFMLTLRMLTSATA